MSLVVFAALAFLVGFLLAWIIRKKGNANKELEAELELYRTKSATLETERTYLLNDKESLTQRLAGQMKELNEAQRLVTEYGTRLQSDAEILNALRKEHTEEKEKHWATKQELIQAGNDHHRLKAELHSWCR